MKRSLMLLLAVCLTATIACNQDTAENDRTENQVAAPEMSLDEAVAQGNIDVIQQHIDAGTDLNAKNPFGSTPLMVATVFNQTEAALALIEGGPDLSVTDNDGSTALHIASFLCRTEVTQALLDNGADRTVRNNFGSTPLESVEAPFETVKPIYEDLQRALAPLGVRFDLERIEQTRPEIAAMLRDEAPTE